MVVFGMLQKFELVYTTLTTLLYSHMKAAEEKHIQFIVDRVDERLSQDTDRKDL